MRAHRQSTPLAQALAATGDRWTLLIVLAIGDGTVRLNTLRERLPGVSSAVLDHHIREMATLGLLTRRRFREMPPRVEVRLTESGATLVPIASALARWGMRHRWSAEAGCERIDADAVLRQLPALLEETELPAGTVEAVLDADEDPRRHLFEIVDGRLALARNDRAVEAVTARIEGDRTAWSIAIGPRRDYSRLRFEGRRALARRVLDALPR